MPTLNQKTHRKRIGIIDLNIGNTGSIINIIKSIGGIAERVQKHQHIENFDALILPGVGKFDHGITRLRDRGFADPLTKSVIFRKTPMLGICLGMQLMCNDSQEGTCEGLRWIDASIKRLPTHNDGERAIIPHMGWNRTHTRIKNGPLKNLNDTRFYFVHSYALIEANEELQTATTTYGTEFISGFTKDNITAVQFHPEKSHKHGKIFFFNFLNWISHV